MCEPPVEGEYLGELLQRIARLLRDSRTIDETHTAAAKANSNEYNYDTFTYSRSFTSIVPFLGHSLWTPLQLARLSMLVRQKVLVESPE